MDSTKCYIIVIYKHGVNTFLRRWYKDTRLLFTSVTQEVGWLVGFYGISTNWVILCRIRFYLRSHIIYDLTLFTNEFFFMNTIFLQTKFFYDLMFWSI